MKLLYSLKEIEERYGIKVSMLKKLISNKEITVVKVGVKNFIRETDIEEYILSHTVSKR